MRKLGEGKTKIVYESSQPGQVLLKFKDDITALDGVKKDRIEGKGSINARLSAFLFRLLEEKGIPTHFISVENPSTLRVLKLEMIPVEVVCRNIAAGRLVKTYPFYRHGEVLNQPLVEFFLKDDAYHDPLLSEEHLKIFGLMGGEEIVEAKQITLKVNAVLKEFLRLKGLRLVDFKLEFGRDFEGRLRVGDELNLDSMRLWREDGKSLDKDVYRRGGSLSEVAEVYRTAYKMITGEEA